MLWRSEKMPCRSISGEAPSSCNAVCWSPRLTLDFLLPLAVCSRFSNVSGATTALLISEFGRRPANYRATRVRQWPHSKSCKKLDSFSRRVNTFSIPSGSRVGVGREAGVSPGFPSTTSRQPTSGRIKTPVHSVQHKNDLRCTQYNTNSLGPGLWCTQYNANQGLMNVCGVPSATYLL